MERLPDWTKSVVRKIEDTILPWAEAGGIAEDDGHATDDEKDVLESETEEFEDLEESELSDESDGGRDEHDVCECRKVRSFLICVGSASASFERGICLVTSNVHVEIVVCSACQGKQMCHVRIAQALQRFPRHFPAFRPQRRHLPQRLISTNGKTFCAVECNTLCVNLR